MKKKKLTTFTFFLFFFPVILFAQVRPLTSHNSVADLLNGIVDFLYNISFLIAPLMIIIAGFIFVTSAGIPKKIAKAKDILLYTFVGFLVIGLARGLINLIAREFGR